MYAIDPEAELDQTHRLEAAIAKRVGSIGPGPPACRGLATGTDLRVRPPTENQVCISVEGDLVVRAEFDVPVDERLSMPGTILSRKYKGRIVLALVLRRGFEYEGVRRTDRFLL